MAIMMLQPTIIDTFRQVQAMAITGPQVMTIIWQGQLTRFMNKNKHIQLWYQRLANVNNARVVKAFELVDSINLGLIKEYNLAEVLINSKNLYNFKDNS